MATFLDISSSPPSSSHRPRTSAVSPAPHQWDHDQDCRQLPPMSSSMTLPESPTRPRNRIHAHGSKRLSVFGLRSRSNTANSLSSSSFKSPASSMTSSEGSSQRSSQDGRNLSNFAISAEKEEPLAKSLLSRGSRILRRQGSKFSISATLTLDEEDDMAKERTKHHHHQQQHHHRHNHHGSESKSDRFGILHRSHRTRNSEMHEFVKRHISEPYDFKHVTHTNPGQLPPANHTHPIDLATEFSIIRASQRPRCELKGIRAENIHYKDPPMDENYNLETLAPDAQSLYTRSPPRSPVTGTMPRSPEPSPPKLASRSIENFSRPVSRMQKQSSTPSIIPPPRISSVAACPAMPDATSQTIDVLLGLHDLTSSESLPVEKEEEVPRVVETSPITLNFPETTIATAIGHAFSPDENSSKPPARHSPLGHHTTDLADVPEEDEAASRRNSRAVVIPSIRFRQPSPTSERAMPQQFTPLLDPPFEDPLPSPTISNGQSVRERSVSPPEEDNSRRDSTRSNRDGFNLSWEDDIDYCYEHAAESNCDFDWDAVDVGTQRPFNWPESQKSKSRGLTIVPVNHSGQTTPDLQPASGLSNSTRPGSLSPAMSGVPGGYFVPPNEPAEKQSSTRVSVMDPQFEDGAHGPPIFSGVVPEIHGGEDQYDYSSTVNNRAATASPISKYNSQESLILSRAASIARKHRSSTSTNSVPDLIHSPSCSRETVDREASTSIADHNRTTPRSPVSPIHMRSTSLAREVCNQLTSVDEAVDTNTKSPSPVPPPPSHDRAKSASILDTFETTSTKPAAATGRKRSSTLSRSLPTRKGRTSYSLFPVPAGTSPSLK